MFQSASERLRKDSAEIMKRWQGRAYVEVPAALYQNSPALKDSLPKYLELLSAALSATADKSKIRWVRKEIARAGRRHGRERAGSRNYTLDQLIFEYHILRQVIFEVMEEQAPLGEVEREIILSSIEQAVNDAATEFSDTLRDIQEFLSSTLVHDLRTPIAGARLNAELILGSPGDADKCAKSAMQISRSMDRIDFMIADLLDASRLRAGEELPLPMKACDLDALVKDTIEELNEIVAPRFVYRSEGAVVGVWNADGLRRIIENIASNAVKYGLPDSPIAFSIEQSESAVILSVHNDGKAIPKEEQDILFQQFRRARSSEDKEGWGLGLAVVKGLAEAHGGKVRVESAEGRGTRFVIELPKKPPQQDKPGQ